jgi:hypothetical protein
MICDVLYDVLCDVLGEWELLIRWESFFFGGGGRVWREAYRPVWLVKL